MTLDKLEKLLFEDIPPEEVDELLREMGYDPIALGERMKQVAEKALSKSPLYKEK